jgi:hypothetical protein
MLINVFYVTNLLTLRTENVLTIAVKDFSQLLTDNVTLALNYVKLAQKKNVYNVTITMLFLKIPLASHNAQMDLLNQEMFVLNVMTHFLAKNVKLMN